MPNRPPQPDPGRSNLFSRVRQPVPLPPPPLGAAMFHVPLRAIGSIKIDDMRYADVAYINKQCGHDFPKRQRLERFAKHVLGGDFAKALLPLKGRTSDLNVLLRPDGMETFGTWALAQARTLRPGANEAGNLAREKFIEDLSKSLNPTTTKSADFAGATAIRPSAGGPIQATPRSPNGSRRDLLSGGARPRSLAACA